MVVERINFNFKNLNPGPDLSPEDLPLSDFNVSNYRIQEGLASGSLLDLGGVSSPRAHPGSPEKEREKREKETAETLFILLDAGLDELYARLRDIQGQIAVADSKIEELTIDLETLHQERQALEEQRQTKIELEDQKSEAGQQLEEVTEETEEVNEELQQVEFEEDVLIDSIRTHDREAVAAYERMKALDKDTITIRADIGDGRGETRHIVYEDESGNYYVHGLDSDRIDIDTIPDKDPSTDAEFLKAEIERQTENGMFGNQDPQAEDKLKDSNEIMHRLSHQEFGDAGRLLSAIEQLNNTKRDLKTRLQQLESKQGELRADLERIEAELAEIDPHLEEKLAQNGREITEKTAELDWWIEKRDALRAEEAQVLARIEELEGQSLAAHTTLTEIHDYYASIDVPFEGPAAITETVNNIPDSIRSLLDLTWEIADKATETVIEAATYGAGLLQDTITGLEENITANIQTMSEVRHDLGAVAPEIAQFTMRLRTLESRVVMADIDIEGLPLKPLVYQDENGGFYYRHNETEHPITDENLLAGIEQQIKDGKKLGNDERVQTIWNRRLEEFRALENTAHGSEDGKESGDSKTPSKDQDGEQFRELEKTADPQDILEQFYKLTEMTEKTESLKGNLSALKDRQAELDTQRAELETRLETLEETAGGEREEVLQALNENAELQDKLKADIEALQEQNSTLTELLAGVQDFIDGLTPDMTEAEAETEAEAQTGQEQETENPAPEPAPEPEDTLTLGRRVMAQVENGEISGETLSHLLADATTEEREKILDKLDRRGIEIKGDLEIASEPAQSRSPGPASSFASKIDDMLEGGNSMLQAAFESSADPEEPASKPAPDAAPDPAPETPATDKTADIGGGGLAA